jgi:HAMP domain-containing protein
VVKWPDGVERITGSAIANQVPWLVSIGLPTEYAFATVRLGLGWGAFFSILTLLISFGIAWMLSGHIARPLRQLGRDASTLAAGDLSHRSKVQAEDEVGRLAAAFNRMAASLEQRESEAMGTANDLRQANATLAAVIDASPVAIVCSDLDRRIIIWSRAAEHIFGYTADEAMGRPANAVPPKYPPDRHGRRDHARPAVDAPTQGRHAGECPRRGGADLQCRRHHPRRGSCV